MFISMLNPGRIAMSQKKSDLLKTMHAVLRGECNHAEAAPRP